MLFNSYPFIFIFLPVTVGIFYLLTKTRRHQYIILWLAAASLFFYGYAHPGHIALMLSSIAFNYCFGILIAGSHLQTARKAYLCLGIAGNLGLLCYFKYMDFFIGSLNSWLHTDIPALHIILPIGISFFTFQQIAYLVECHQNKVFEPKLANYTLFVTFFPHLIAGPIVHPRVLLPQLRLSSAMCFKANNIAVGATVFAIGLFKKVVIADTMARYASPVFLAAANGHPITFVEAWFGVLAFSFQIYFDFSGYSDMATGLARFFGLRLPINFFSPYKARNIIDFWRRWHITLSSFLRDYVYIPLGGNRRGQPRAYLNIMLTMLLGGLWHGANWTFVLWGGLHGFFIVLNHSWQNSLKTLFPRRSLDNPFSRALGILATFFCVTIAWAVFRAKDLGTAFNLFNAMTGANGLMLWEANKGLLNKLFGLGDWMAHAGVTFGAPRLFPGISDLGLVLSLFLFVWLLPNTYELMAKYRPNYHLTEHYKNFTKGWLYWRPTVAWALFYAAIFIVTILSLSKASEFIYYQF